MKITTAKTAAAQPAIPLDHFLAHGPGTWGKGTTEKEALRQLRKAYGSIPEQRILFRCTKGTYVDGNGSTCYERQGLQPIEYKRFGIPKAKD